MQTLGDTYQELLHSAKQNNHRRLLVVSGARDWCYQQLRSLAPLFPKGTLCITEDVLLDGFGVIHLPSQRAHQHLGETLPGVVFDAWSGFNPNHFAQICGALKGGAVLVLLCPELNQWPAYNDPEHKHLTVEPYLDSDVGRGFITRLALLLQDDAYTLIYQPAQRSGVSNEVIASEDESYNEIDLVPPFLSGDQQQAVELVINQFRRGRRPVVLTADRGRGKSAALGIAAAQLSGLGYQQVIVTAPEQGAVESLFSIAHQLLPDCSLNSYHLQGGGISIRYLEPEQALKEVVEGRVLLVDEAAAIPVPMLSRLAEHFPRVAFASTVHGYEGTGRGFSLRFLPFLQQHYANTRCFHLEQPIRWAGGDPLEQFSFTALMMNAELAPAPIDQQHETVANVLIEKVDRSALVEDYTALKQLFGLLVNAHYRTTPGDLRILLDAPNLHLWWMKLDNEVIGAALVAEEGVLEAELAEQVWAGKRRPRGHLLPQALIAQEGIKRAASLRCGRVVRIAIHPELQQLGLGSRLLSSVAVQAEEECWDYLGASFSSSESLLKFWQQNGFITVRIGYQKDAVTGGHALLVVKALSEPGEELQQLLQRRFSERLYYRLADDLAEVEASVICSLLQQQASGKALSPEEWDELTAFVEHHRSYENCSYTIYKLLLLFISSAEPRVLSEFLQHSDFILLLKRSLQRQHWYQLEQDGQGRRQLSKQLKGAVSRVIQHVAAP